jgi:hypothetical protein
MQDGERVGLSEVAREFAQAILGRRVPSRNPEVIAQEKRAQLEWLATFSPRHEEELRRLRREEARAREREEHLAWLASISAVSEAEWDPTKHPRGGFSQNRGWFSPTSGAGDSGAAPAVSTGAASHNQQRRTLDDQRAQSRIESRSGDNWSGERVLNVVRGIAPGWLTFVKRHFIFSLTSNGSKEPTTVVRQGKDVHVEIPADWNDIQVAEYIFSKLADEIDVHRLAADWAAQHPGLYDELREERFRNGMPTIAALAGGYYTALAGVTPSGQVSVVIWDILDGDQLAAAIDLASLIPFGNVAKAGSEFAGALAIHAGDRLVAVLPPAAIEKLSKLAPEQKILLHKRLLVAKTEQEAADIVAEFLKTTFNKHHPLPMFLGGHTQQLLAKIPESIHKEFHSALREELKKSGLTRRIGGPGGSAADWAEYLGDESRQGLAFNAVLKAARAMDAKHGTEITRWVWANLLGENFFRLPK